MRLTKSEALLLAARMMRELHHKNPAVVGEIWGKDKTMGGEAFVKEICRNAGVEFPMPEIEAAAKEE